MPTVLEEEICSNCSVRRSLSGHSRYILFRTRAPVPDPAVGSYVRDDLVILVHLPVLGSGFLNIFNFINMHSLDI